jgi:hypothetical protein
MGEATVIKTQHYGARVRHMAYMTDLAPPTTGWRFILVIASCAGGCYVDFLRTTTYRASVV